VVGTADLFSYPEQATLVNALRAVVPTVMVSLRTPYDVLVAPSVNGLVCAYTGRDPTLRAVAEILLGQRAPVGTLPVSIPGYFPLGAGLRSL
jgi:beta-N-acetylhexosaminidase